MGPQLIRLAAAALVAGVVALPVSATVLVPADFRELAKEAAVIVHGRVVDVRGVWTDGRRSVETIVTVEVLQALKGQTGRHVSLRVPGGELGRYRSVMVGAPAFREGEDVVLFLGGRAPALPYLLGLGQGVYRVRRDPASGREVVAPPGLVAERAPGTKIVRGDPARRPVGLDEFTRHVRAVLADGADGERTRRRPVGGKVIR